jgi:hypothetical protein
VGLRQQHVSLLHQTDDWLHYRLPENYIRRHKSPLVHRTEAEVVPIGTRGRRGRYRA